MTTEQPGCSSAALRFGPASRRPGGSAQPCGQRTWSLNASRHHRLSGVQLMLSDRPLRRNPHLLPGVGVQHNKNHSSICLDAPSKSEPPPWKEANHGPEGGKLKESLDSRRFHRGGIFSLNARPPVSWIQLTGPGPTRLQREELLSAEEPNLQRRFVHVSKASADKGCSLDLNGGGEGAAGPSRTSLQQHQHSGTCDLTAVGFCSCRYHSNFHQHPFE